MDHTHCKKGKLIKIESEILCTRPGTSSASKEDTITTYQRKFKHYIILDSFVI